MKGFIKQLVTNRLGIILATLNLCYLVSRHFITYDFSHGYGSACQFTKNFNLIGLKMQYSEIMFFLNLPALFFSLIPGGFISSLFSKVCIFEMAQIQIVLLAFFITFQWLFIGWTAKKIASAIRPNLD